MPRVCALPCLVFAFAALSLAAQNVPLPLFPSRTEPVQLQSKDGQTITAVIHDVSPDNQSARLFVEDRRDTFTVSLDLFDSNSQTILHDWFYKRLINERLSIRNEEISGSSTDLGAPMNNDTSGRYRNPSSGGTRNRKMVATIYNPSAYPISAIYVVHGVQVSHSITDTGLSRKPADREKIYNSHHSIRSIEGRAEIKVESPPVQLESSTTIYTNDVMVTIPGRGTFTEKRRHSRKETDRISASYVLVYYKNELVAATTTRSNLITESLQYRTKAFATSTAPARGIGAGLDDRVSRQPQVSANRHEYRHRLAAAEVPPAKANQPNNPDESESEAENTAP